MTRRSLCRPVPHGRAPRWQTESPKRVCLLRDLWCPSGAALPLPWTTPQTKGRRHADPQPDPAHDRSLLGRRHPGGARERRLDLLPGRVQRPPVRILVTYGNANRPRRAPAALPLVAAASGPGPRERDARGSGMARLPRRGMDGGARPPARWRARRRRDARHGARRRARTDHRAPGADRRDLPDRVAADHYGRARRGHGCEDGQCYQIRDQEGDRCTVAMPWCADAINARNVAVRK